MSYNKANRYIKQHGLCFNPSKTSCMLFGNNPFDSLPVWTIDGVNLLIESSITYLGAELSPHCGNKHTHPFNTTCILFLARGQIKQRWSITPYCYGDHQYRYSTCPGIWVCIRVSLKTESI